MTQIAGATKDLKNTICSSVLSLPFPPGTIVTSKLRKHLPKHTHRFGCDKQKKFSAFSYLTPDSSQL